MSDVPRSDSTDAAVIAHFDFFYGVLAHRVFNADHALCIVRSQRKQAETYFRKSMVTDSARCDAYADAAEARARILSA